MFSLKGEAVAGVENGLVPRAAGLQIGHREVLSLVWERGDSSVRDICARLESTVAYTTVMTTMDRLFKKGLLSRRKAGRAFVYRATVTRNELDGAVAAELVQSLLQRDGNEPLPILSSLVDAVSDRDRALLDDLERLIREKRRANHQ